MRVTGAVNVRLSATSTNGEKFTTSTKVYIADIEDFYLSYDALRGLNVVNVHFPAPRNQHGGRSANEKCWDRSGRVIEKLQHGSY